ncbi:uncharacterized protein LOC124795103 isoform X3 [Schistocerca piceifrons]|uniref:uncharacterized protein LOC124795103 isoform X3 n=1 Tax=Schistocerca piceifrons TaxID=274613 RepID=UPI001F5F5FC0|nr:uncharacterized protein LOC124795103 isoform X3 [Schistocerca piceifrons]
MAGILKFWAEFFQAAGLEPAVAASYANIFFVNKIQPSHLPDIDRDALREMNITPMGDILTILKYIKISCPLVSSSTTTISGNEQLLLYQGDILKPHAQFRNIQDPKSGCSGQNQFGCDTQHTITQVEKSFLSRLSPSACQIQPLPSATTTHYLQSASIQAGDDLPSTTVVRESPLNLILHGNSSSKKETVSENCELQCVEMPDCETSNGILSSSINSTVSCDTPEATSNIYSISPDKLDGLKYKFESSMNDSDVECFEQQQPLSFSPPVVPNTSLQYNKHGKINCVYNTKETLPRRLLMERSKQDCSQNIASEMAYTKCAMNQRFSKEKIIAPGGVTPYQKPSVFERLGRRSDVKEVWVKKSCKPFRQNQQCRSELRLKATPQRDNGIMRSNHVRKKWQYSSTYDDQRNNNTESVNKMALGPEPLCEESLCLQSKTYNEDTNKALISASHLNSDKTASKYSTVNNKKQLQDVSNGNLNGAVPSDTDRNDICQNSPQELHQELHSVQESPRSSTSRIPLAEPKDGNTTRSASDNVKLSLQETLTRGPDAIIITHTPQNEDPELKNLRDPTLTRHTEQFYLAWADRRKRAHSFPGKLNVMCVFF